MINIKRIDNEQRENFCCDKCKNKETKCDMFLQTSNEGHTTHLCANCVEEMYKTYMNVLISIPTKLKFTPQDLLKKSTYAVPNTPENLRYLENQIPNSTMEGEGEHIMLCNFHNDKLEDSAIYITTSSRVILGELIKEPIK